MGPISVQGRPGLQGEGNWLTAAPPAPASRKHLSLPASGKLLGSNRAKAAGLVVTSEPAVPGHPAYPP